MGIVGSRAQGAREMLRPSLLGQNGGWLCTLYTTGQSFLRENREGPQWSHVDPRCDCSKKKHLC